MDLIQCSFIKRRVALLHAGEPYINLSFPKFPGLLPVTQARVVPNALFSFCLAISHKYHKTLLLCP